MSTNQDRTYAWALRKQQLRERIEAKRHDIQQQIEILCTPDDNSTMQKRWINNLGKGIAIADGVLTGWRIYKRISHFLPNKWGKKAKR